MRSAERRWKWFFFLKIMLEVVSFLFYFSVYSLIRSTVKRSQNKSSLWVRNFKWNMFFASSSFRRFSLFFSVFVSFVVSDMMNHTIRRERTEANGWIETTTATTKKKNRMKRNITHGGCFSAARRIQNMRASFYSY